MKYTKEIIEAAVKQSNTKGECLKILGMFKGGGAYFELDKYILKYNIDSSHFLSRSDIMKKCLQHKKTYSLNEITIENSSYPTTSLKDRLYKEGLKERKCELCGQGEEWNGKKMSLILDHINGINNDHRIENLRIICPNCNATTDTFCRGTKLKKNESKTSKPFIKVKYYTHSLPKIELIKNNLDKISFNKKGWRIEVAKILNVKPQYAGHFIERNFPDIWQVCYKHKDRK